MRKIFTNVKAVITSMVIMATVAGSVSCTYDDTAVWGEINKIKQDVEQLRTELDGVLAIVKNLQSGDLAIRKVELQEDGSKIVTLSNGSKITIYPKGGGHTEVVTITTGADGVRYWAMYDGLGQAQPILVDGKKVPVADLVPQTQVNAEGAIEVSFDGGNTWIVTGYEESVADAIIENVEVVYSDWQTDADGNPLGLYCVVTFTDGSTMKVGMQNGKLVLDADSMFVAYGMTGEFYIQIQDAVDFIMQTPEGWECDAELKAKKEYMALTITAPTLDAINAGEALSSGIIKLMVVFDNGSSAIASLRVSTNPATVKFTSKGLHIEAGYGANYLVGALISKSAYDTNMSTYLELANEHLAGNTSSQIYDFSFNEVNTLYVEYKDLVSTLKNGNEYYFWYAAPNTDAEGNMYIEMKDVCSYYYKHVVPTLTATKKDFFDFTVTFKVAGYDEDHNYMLGLCPANEFNAQELATYYTENPEYFNASFSAAEYKGELLSFVDPYAAKLDPGSDYVVWYINESSLPNVLESDVYSWNLTTKAFTDGGSIKVEYSDVQVEYTSISMTLNSTNHIAMYYNLLPSYVASAYTTDELAIQMLASEGERTYTAEPVNVSFTKAKAGDKFVLFAVAVDKEGKYGEVLKQEFSTKSFVYNDLTVTLEELKKAIDNTLIKPICDDAQKFVYVYARTDSDEWKTVLGGTKKKAGEYMIEFAGNSRIHDTSTEQDALVDGCIQLTGLTMDEEYAIVVMAVDAEGGYSSPVAHYFKPLANIGIVVKRTDDNWTVGKPTINVLAYEDNPLLFLNFAWEFVPAEHTKVYSAAMFPMNFNNEELGTEIDTVEEMIANIMASCDTGGMGEQGKSGEWQESGIYIREWIEWEDSDDDGYIDEVYHSEERAGVYHFFPYGSSEETYIYTTWVGEDGNFHEPFAIDPTTGEEVDIWTGNPL